MEKKLLKIINYYGVDHQQRKLEEEVFELNKAITQMEYPAIGHKPDDLKMMEKCHIEEEVGDVLNVLYQFILYYDLDMNNITKGRVFKIDRTLGEIKK